MNEKSSRYFPLFWCQCFQNFHTFEVSISKFCHRNGVNIDVKIVIIWKCWHHFCGRIWKHWHQNSGNFGNIDTKIVENIVRIFNSITVLGGLENEFGNFKNSSRILKTSCKTYKKFLLLDRVPLSFLFQRFTISQNIYLLYMYLLHFWSKTTHNCSSQLWCHNKFI